MAKQLDTQDLRFVLTATNGKTRGSKLTNGRDGQSITLGAPILLTTEDGVDFALAAQAVAQLHGATAKAEGASGKREGTDAARAVALFLGATPTEEEQRKVDTARAAQLKKAKELAGTTASAEPAVSPVRQKIESLTNCMTALSAGHLTVAVLKATMKDAVKALAKFEKDGVGTEAERNELAACIKEAGEKTK